MLHKKWQHLMAMAISAIAAGLLVLAFNSTATRAGGGARANVSKAQPSVDEGSISLTHHIYFPLVTRAEQPEQAIPLREESGSIGGMGESSEECYEDATSDSPTYLFWGSADETGGAGVVRLLNSAATPPYCGVQRMYLEFDTSNVSTVDTTHLVLPVWKKDRYGYTWTDFTVHEGTWQAGTLTDDLYSTWNAWTPTPLATEVVTEAVTKTISLPGSVVQPGGITRLTIRPHPEAEEPDFRAEARFDEDAIKLILSP